MSANNDLSAEQIEQLSAIFRSEAIEHIKKIAAILFAAEDDTLTDRPEAVNSAFREAHSLKGSAGTLGFERVAVMAHRFEDALGTLKAPNVELTAKRIDCLLQSLETIRQAVAGSIPGDEEITDREKATLANLEKSFPLDAISNKAPPSAQKTPTSSEPPKEASPPAPQGLPTSSPKKRTGNTDSATEMVRVSERQIDQVIQQFGELSETNLQLEAVTHDLQTNIDETTRLQNVLFELQTKLENTPFEGDIMEVFDMSRNLSILTKASLAKFTTNHREFTKQLGRAQDALRELRIAPLSTLHYTIRSQVREVSGTTGKRVDLHLSGGEYAVDRGILVAIEKPVSHIIRNAIDHGIEAPTQREAAGKPQIGNLTVAGRHLGDSVELTIEDDGGGIDPEDIRNALVSNYGVPKEKADELSREQLLDQLFEAGFSTNRKVSRISGRGVGMDVVKYTIEHLGGEVQIQSEKGRGTTIVMRLPLTMSQIKCLLLEVANQTMAIPAANISRVCVLKSQEVSIVGGCEVLIDGGKQIPLTTFEEVLGLKKHNGDTAHSHHKFATIIRFGNRRYGFKFSHIHEYTQLVIKPLGDLLERVPNVAGITLLGTGRQCLVLNPSDLIRNASGKVGIENRHPVAQKRKEVPIILVVDDSIAIRTMQQTLLESAGFRVLTASDGLQALQMIGNHKIDLVLSDVQMPNMDGFELTSAIKSRAHTRSIPVILITSLGAKKDIAKGMNAGADAHIVKKELTRSELLDTINQLI